MERIRKPFQGVWNIIRFNWHFYALSTSFVIVVLIISAYINTAVLAWAYTLCTFVILSIVISLLVSYYVYDVSILRKFTWMDGLSTAAQSKIVNIHAGFDETSGILEDKFPSAELTILDFYDPAKHTEVSIKRARKAYPPFTGTRPATADNLGLTDNFADVVFVIFAAHEIRNKDERIVFFKEINRVVKTGGQVIVAEHLRDFANFAAYNIGFFHFFSKFSWLKTFREANLTVTKHIKLTPFISIFILAKNGNPY